MTITPFAQSTVMMSHMNQQGQHMSQQQPPTSQQQQMNANSNNYMHQQQAGGDGSTGSGEQPMSNGPPGGGNGDGVDGNGSPSDPASSNRCIRVGCPNLAVANSEWEDEYCSNECVVTHCRDVFNSWVASKQKAVK
ncbi:FAD1 flavin adenine dinucleotide synthetase homolog (S. cerevisiae) [Nesidiocoris tenuis]|uniref:FAD1 flavin adenine dinucleotide synthetase homolog (S. cerevisiae) n=1 Tax=Nesidiocoris tenuis TaxID=355587 RepID=A0ABN7AWR8_9HEMI|nr:FAD1 flavin adenine dinucleotide synthetase homolog (S. cerevisiae) [Nesidiocoris tenuis]